MDSASPGSRPESSPSRKEQRPWVLRGIHPFLLGLGLVIVIAIVVPLILTSGGGNAPTTEQHRTQDHATQGGAPSGPQENTSATTSTTSPTTNAGGTTASLSNNCSNGVSTTQGVPCGLAHNVFYEYYRAVESGRDTTALSAWSPQVRQYRTANCSKGTGVITCQILGTTEANAKVQITQAALDAYTPAQASEYARTHDLGPSS